MRSRTSATRQTSLKCVDTPTDSSRVARRTEHPGPRSAPIAGQGGMGAIRSRCVSPVAAGQRRINAGLSDGHSEIGRQHRLRLGSQLCRRAPKTSLPFWTRLRVSGRRLARQPEAERHQRRDCEDDGLGLQPRKESIRRRRGLSPFRRRSSTAITMDTGRGLLHTCRGLRRELDHHGRQSANLRGRWCGRQLIVFSATHAPVRLHVPRLSSVATRLTRPDPCSQRHS